MYTINQDDENIYTHLTSLWKNENINQLLLAKYRNGSHFDFLKPTTNNSIF